MPIRTRRTPPPRGARWVPLTRGKWALVDAADYDAVMLLKWHLYVPSKSGGKRKRLTHYARTSIVTCDPYRFTSKRRSVYLHRWLWERWGMPPTEHIDHVDGDGLDCRRSKLRAATHAQNQRNRKPKNKLGLVGVMQDGKRFLARIAVDGQRRYLGSFATADAAARAYDAAAKELHGEFARGNFERAA